MKTENTDTEIATLNPMPLSDIVDDANASAAFHRAAFDCLTVAQAYLPIEVGEAFEDIGNTYLLLSETVREAHR